MRKFITTICFASIALAGFSQNAFVKDNKVINVSLGIGSTLYGSGYSGLIPPVSASLEYCVKDNLFNDKSSIGVGGYLGFATAKQEWTSGGATYGYRYSNYILGARAALHYQFVDKLDTYAGLMLGYNIGTSSQYGNIPGSFSSSSHSGFAYAGFIGARYYFTDKIAALAEIGYGIAYLNLGVAFKL